MPNLVSLNLLWTTVLQYFSCFSSSENINHSAEVKKEDHSVDLESGLQKVDGGVGGEIRLNPISESFKDLDMGKIMIGVVVAVVGAFLTQHAPTSLVLRVLIISCASLGFSAIWIGMMLRSRRHAVMVEQLGAAMALLAFFGIVSSLVPGYYQWAPWGCFLITLLPFYLQLFP